MSSHEPGIDLVDLRLSKLLETRHVRNAFKAMPVKTDRKDARGIAQLMRLGWFRPVHCKSWAAQEVRALLTARKLLQTKSHDVEISLRGVLRGFGLKVGRTTPRTFAGRIRELVTGHGMLSTVAEALLSAVAPFLSKLELALGDLIGAANLLGQRVGLSQPLDHAGA